MIDTVEPGGIFGYMPLLTGGGMEFEARATEPSTLIRLPGCAGAGAVRQAGGPGVPGVLGVEHHASADRATDRPGRPTAGRSANWCTATCWWSPPTTSVRDAVVQMTEHHVSYALIRLPDGDLGIFTDRDLRTRVVAAGCRSTCRSPR